MERDQNMMFKAEEAFGVWVTIILLIMVINKGK